MFYPHVLDFDWLSYLCTVLKSPTSKTQCSQTGFRVWAGWGWVGWGLRGVALALALLRATSQHQAGVSFLMATEVVAYGASTTPTIKALSFFPEASSLLAVAYAIVALPHSLFPIRPPLNWLQRP